MRAKEPSIDDLAAFAAFADAFESADFLPGEWLSPQPSGDADSAFPIWASGDVVSRWHQALYDRDIVDPDSDYLSEAFAQQMDEFVTDPTLLSAADLSTIRTVLTNISRGDRFCDGYMASMFENDVSQAATARLVSLSAEDGAP